MTSPDDRVLFDVDSEKRIATITLNNPGQRNSYDATMRDTVARHLDRVAEDDDINGGVASRRGRCVQHRCGHEQCVRLVRR